MELVRQLAGVKLVYNTDNKEYVISTSQRINIGIAVVLNDGIAINRKNLEWYLPIHIVSSNADDAVYALFSTRNNIKHINTKYKNKTLSAEYTDKIDMVNTYISLLELFRATKNTEMYKQYRHELLKRFNIIYN